MESNSSLGQVKGGGREWPWEVHSSREVCTQHKRPNQQRLGGPRSEPLGTGLALPRNGETGSQLRNLYKTLALGEARQQRALPLLTGDS